MPIIGIIIFAMLGALAVSYFVDRNRRPVEEELDPPPKTRAAHVPAREVVLAEFDRRKQLGLWGWSPRPGWVEVPDLIAALCCPAGMVVRSTVQARAALAELYQKGIIELELVSQGEALRSGHPLTLFLPGPRGQYFRWARLAQVELAQETTS